MTNKGEYARKKNTNELKLFQRVPNYCFVSIT